MQVSAEFRCWWEGDAPVRVRRSFDGKGVIERRTDFYVRMAGARHLSV